MAEYYLYYCPVSFSYSFIWGPVLSCNPQELLKTGSDLSGKERGVVTFWGMLGKCCQDHQVSWVFERHFW